MLLRSHYIIVRNLKSGPKLRALPLALVASSSAPLDAFWLRLINLFPRALTFNDHFPDPIGASGPGCTLFHTLQ